MLCRNAVCWLFVAVLVSLAMNSSVLGERFVSDLGWHASIAREFQSGFPAVPHDLPLVRQGVRFTYPPLSYFLAAAVKHAFPDVRLVVVMRYIMLLFISISVVPVYLLGAGFFRSREAGLAAAFLFAVSPLHLAYYQYAQTIALPFALASVFFAALSLDRRSRPFALVSGVFLGVAYWTHLFPALFVSGILFAVSVFYLASGDRRMAFLPLLALCVSVVFLLAYLLNAGLLSGLFAHGFPSRVFPMLVPDRFDVIGDFFVERFLLSALGLAGLFSYLRGASKSPLLSSFVIASLALSLAGLAGLYLFVVPLSYARYLVVALSLLGGLALCRSFAGLCRVRALLLAVLFVYSVQVVLATSEKYVGLPPEDMRALGWMRENLEPGSVVATDNGHAFWVPFVADKGTINGRKLDEFADGSRDVDVARIFSADPGVKLRLMSAYGSSYVLYSNDTLRRYPRITMEDRWGPAPASAVWLSPGSGPSSFAGAGLRVVYSDSGRASVIVYER